MRKLHMREPRVSILSRNYNEILPCTFKGIRCWQSTAGSIRCGDLAIRLFDYNTYEYIGTLMTPGKLPELLMNPVYAIKYKEKYPVLFDICISQKLVIKQNSSKNHYPWPIFGNRCVGRNDPDLSSPEAIQHLLEEDYDLHIKTGVYSFKYETSL